MTLTKVSLDLWLLNIMGMAVATDMTSEGFLGRELGGVDPANDPGDKRRG